MTKSGGRLVRYMQDDNEARWATDEEIIGSQNVLQIDIENDNCNGCGIPIISDGRKIYVDNGDTHTMIVGATGSKKTRLIGMPTIGSIIMAGESFVTTDPKGELFQKTAPLASAKGYDIFVLNLRNLAQSGRWNPLALPYQLYHGGEREKAVSILNDLISVLVQPQIENTRDNYFAYHGSNLFLANALVFLETASPEEANLKNFAEFCAKESTAEMIEEIRKYCADGSIAAINYSGELTNKTAQNTFGNIASCMMLMLSPFIMNKSLCQVLSENCIDMGDIGKTKTAIYIIVPDEKTTLHFLATLFVKQVYESLIDFADRQEDKKLHIRVNLVLDEFANIPKIQDIGTMLTASRSRNMRFYLLVQGLRQIQSRYGENDAHTIMGNCSNLIYLYSRELELLKEISELCGKRMKPDNRGEFREIPLIAVTELQQLKKERGEALMMLSRNKPYVTELPDIDDYAFGAYPQILQNDSPLPEITRYSIDNVIAEIKKGERPLLFLEETGEKQFFVETKRNTDIFDW